MIPAWPSLIPGGWIWLAILGLCLGSFLNVVVHRLPRGLSLLRPGSRCPRCQHPIRPWDNLPVVGYLILGGRCRDCRETISIRYPLVELLGAVCVLTGSLLSPDPVSAAVRILFLLVMAAVTLIDLDHRIIPDEISLPGIVLGLLVCPLLGVSRVSALIGMAAGAGSLLAVALAYRWIRGTAGMGMGDVKLAGMLGAFLGWKGVFLSILIGSLLGSLFGLTLLATRRGSGRTALPYGTFVAPAAAVVLLFGERLLLWYFDLCRGPRF